MHPLLRAFDRTLMAIITALLIVMVSVVAWQVFTRYVLASPAGWTEEIARYTFTWEIFLGAALAFGRGSHITVEAFLLAVGPRVRRAAAVLAGLLSLSLLVPLVYFGIAMVELTSNTYATASRLNIGVVYAALPVGATIGAAYVVLHIITILRGGKPVTAQALLTD